MCCDIKTFFVTLQSLSETTAAHQQGRKFGTKALERWVSG